MRRHIAASVILAAVCVSGTACTGSRPGGTDPSAADPTTPVVAAPATTTNDAPPPDPKPVSTGKCPYLDTDWIAFTNGQHVAKVQLSADTPHPACFFLRPDGGFDVMVQVFTGSPKAANALVNRVAPVATSDKASDPAGWTGGEESFGKTDGAVYAVRKEGTGTAVVVKVDQAQTYKAKLIAEKAIQTLGL